MGDILEKIHMAEIGQPYQPSLENDLKESIRRGEGIKSSLFTCKYLLPCGKCDKYNKVCSMTNVLKIEYNKSF